MSIDNFLKNATIQAQGHPGSLHNFEDEVAIDDVSNDIVSGLSNFNPLEDNPTIHKKKPKFRYELDLRTLICAVIGFVIVVLISVYISYRAGISSAFANSEMGINGEVVASSPTRPSSQVTDNSDGDALWQCQANLTALQQASSAGAGLVASPQAVDANGVVNLNLASAEELQTLKGVGPSTAQKIIDYRTQNGNFKTIEELKEVKGIGDATFDKLKDKIRVK